MKFRDVGVLKWVRKYMRLTSYQLRYLFRAAKLYLFASRPANMEITEPRFLTGEEQKGLCKIAVNAAANQLGINPGDTRCFIKDQVVAPSTQGRRLQTGEDHEFTFSINLWTYFDQSIHRSI